MTDVETERKIQFIGGSTYTVSLPKEWADDQQIEPGTSVTLYGNTDRLIIEPNKQAQNSKQTTIDTTEISSDVFAHLIRSAYIAGCDKIRVVGFDNTRERQAIVRAITQLIGLEVLSEDEDTLLAQAVYNSNTLSPPQILKRMKRTVLDMHADAINAVTEPDPELGNQIIQQDNAVDRLLALLSRDLQRSLTDLYCTPSANELTLFEYCMAARQLERVGDHAEKIAQTATQLDGDPSDEHKDRLLRYGKQSRELVANSITGLLNGQPPLSETLRRGDESLADIHTVDEQLYPSNMTDQCQSAILIDSIRRTIEYGINIAEIGLQFRFRTDCAQE
jgi:phosphate uptake regulator